MSRGKETVCSIFIYFPNTWKVKGKSIIAFPSVPLFLSLLSSKKESYKHNNNDWILRLNLKKKLCKMYICRKVPEDSLYSFSSHFLSTLLVIPNPHLLFLQSFHHIFPSSFGLCFSWKLQLIKTQGMMKIIFFPLSPFCTICSFSSHSWHHFSLPKNPITSPSRLLNVLILSLSSLFIFFI